MLPHHKTLKIIGAWQGVFGPGAVWIGKPSGGPVGKVSGVLFGARCKDSASKHLAPSFYIAPLILRMARRKSGHAGGRPVRHRSPVCRAKALPPGQPQASKNELGPDRNSNSAGPHRRVSDDARPRLYTCAEPLSGQFAHVSTIFCRSDSISFYILWSLWSHQRQCGSIAAAGCGAKGEPLSYL